VLLEEDLTEAEVHEDGALSSQAAAKREGAFWSLGGALIFPHALTASRVSLIFGRLLALGGDSGDGTQ